MSWLISLLLAGLISSPEANLKLNTTQVDLQDANVARVMNYDETERLEQNYPFNADGRISVSNVNGSITVEAWDKKEIRLEAVKSADTKEHLSDANIRIDARQDSFRVETDYDKQRTGERNWKNYGKLEVRYRLSVPRGAVLEEIETVNGSVVVSNMTNSVRASAVNGNVTATNLRGAARISTVNGTTEADFDSLDGVNQISLETVNGRVNLTIPSNADATLRADTVNGSITNDFGLPVRTGQYVGKDLYGKIGAGNVKIRLNSVNGELSVKRKNDGKTANPAVNLLPQKSKDDADWDDDAVIDQEKMNKDIAKSMKIAQKNSQAAMKAAQKEIQLIQPELARVNAEIARQAVKVTLNSEDLKNLAKIDEARRKQFEATAKLADLFSTDVASRVEKKSETFTVKGTPKVTIDAKNCIVRVKGWDKSEVQYSVTKYARNGEPVKLKAEQNNSEINISLAEAETGDAFYPNFTGVRLEVFVPRKSNLRIATNKEIRLENVSGDIDLSGGDEAINVRDADGKLTVTAQDAQVRVIGFKGDFVSQTADGDVSLEGDFDKIDAHAGNGMVVLTLPENANASLFSNTAIESSGLNLVKDGDERMRLGKGGAKYKFEFGEGRVYVRSAESLLAGY